jgi:endo-1,4-beta-xylanase
MKSISTLFLVFLTLLSNHNAQAQKSLKKAFAKDFLIGTALGTEHILEKNPKANALIKAEFNAITPENVFKSEAIHPEKGKYNFEVPDKFIAYGEKNGMHLVGHTLVWHSQMPAFASKISSKEEFRAFFEDHIKTVASRYADKINTWDVVNEALEEDGTMRKSIFLNLLGEDYIVEAFRLAAKYTPKSKLYYNDYNIEQPKKRAGAIALIKKIQAAGVKIDGVGIQGHWGLKGASLEDIEASIIAFSELGLEVAFTELDITTLPNPWDLVGADVNQNFENDPKMNLYAAGLPADVEKQFTKRYEDLFKLFLKHKDKISRVTFWGVNDGHSWLNNWPIKGRTNYPLLFDRNFKPKPAYTAIINLKK